MEKITFVNNSEPYLSAENLNQLQDNIENAINETYSTTETKIGKWHDGKDLYRKVVVYTNPLTGGENTIPHNISNVSEIVKVEGKIPFSGNSYNIGAYINNNEFASIVYTNNISVAVHIGSNWANSFTNGCVLTIYYTKTS